MNLQGRSALITGANQGLGRAIAEAYVRAGASVLLMARGADALRQAQERLSAAAGPGQKVLAAAGDVSRPHDCRAAADQAPAELPGLCVLVNNAGVYGPMGPLEEVDWDAWVHAVQVNLFGTALMCREFIPLLRGRGYGKIVNLSGGGATAPLPRISAYAAAKAAVVR